MTGTVNVSRMLFYYHAITLVFLLGFAAYDHRHHRIRNAALLAFLPWCLLYIPAALTEAPACLVLLHCFLGFLCGFLLLLTVSLATGGGIGGGDIKLAAILGIPFGASGLMAVLAASCILVLLHMGIRAICRKGRPRQIPFAPYIFWGSFLYTLLLLPA